MEQAECSGVLSKRRDGTCYACHDDLIIGQDDPELLALFGYANAELKRAR